MLGVERRMTARCCEREYTIAARCPLAIELYWLNVSITDTLAVSDSDANSIK